MQGVGLDEVGCVDIGLVAETGEAGNAHVVVTQQGSKLECEIPALEDQADRPDGKLVRSDGQPGRVVQQAQAIGSEQPCAGDPNLGRHAFLGLAAGLAQLAEPRADPDDSAHPGSESIVDGGLETGGWNRNDGQVDLCADRRDSRRSRPVQDRFARPVHQVHRNRPP